MPFILWDDYAEAWRQEDYPKNDYPFDPGCSYMVRDGSYVRSKSEYILAGVIDELHWPSRYEWLYDGHYFRSYPDFTILNPTDHQLYYIEYLGMMDDPDYVQRAMQKISKYQKTPDAGVLFISLSQNLLL